MTRWAIAGCAVGLLVAGWALRPALAGGPGPASFRPPASQEGAGDPLADMRPAQRLGARVRAVDRAVVAAPFVVVVGDEASYVEALSRWSGGARFPVLIDDGTWWSREAIARFVRAYEPQAVVRWGLQDAGGEGAGRWDATRRRRAMESAMLRAWGLDGDGPANGGDGGDGGAGGVQRRLIAHWRELGAPPPGVVVADAGDSAWPAALALAIGRLQPIVWLSVSGGVNGTIGDNEADGVARSLEGAVEALGLRWREVGDEVDAVTLCLNAPVRHTSLAHGTTALTARIGRHGSASRQADRWAWSGQIFGSRARSAYAAMCSLFLRPREAWLFDGYPDEEPWSAFDVAPAAGIYGEIGLGTLVDDTPSAGVDALLARASVPVGAGVIAFNTKGRMTEFHLSPGRATSRDVPVLGVPAAVYVVHSFSAARLGIRTTVGGAWIDRGAFCYLGSVDEPGLGSFVPQATLAARLGSLFPFGAAVREDGLRENRKLAVFGDPLWMLDPEKGRRVEVRPPLRGATPLPEAAADALEAGDLAAGAWLLRMAGLDDRVVDVALSALRDRPGSVDGRLASASLGALFAAGERRAFAAMFARLGTGADGPAGAGVVRASDAAVQDMAWHALRPLLTDSETAATIARLLSGHVRAQRRGGDAAELAIALDEAGHRGEALTLLRGVLGSEVDGRERRTLEALLERLE